jgi:hypothetical protein
MLRAEGLQSTRRLSKTCGDLASFVYNTTRGVGPQVGLMNPDFVAGTAVAEERQDFCHRRGRTSRTE